MKSIRMCLSFITALFVAALMMCALPATAAGVWGGPVNYTACNPGAGCNAGLTTEKAVGACPTVGATYHYYIPLRSCNLPLCRVTIAVYEQTCY